MAVQGPFANAAWSRCSGPLRREASDHPWGVNHRPVQASSSPQCVTCSTPADARCRHTRRMLFEPAPDLRLANDLADIHANEVSRGVRHVPQHVEVRFCRLGVFLGIEEPKGVLDEIPTIDGTCPIATI